MPLNKFDFSSLLDKGEKGSGEEGRGKGLENTLHDVEFVFGSLDRNEEGVVKAHKLLLTLLSEVFRAQFTGPVADTSKEQDGVTRIIVEDTSYSAFKTMIQYLYEGNESTVQCIKDPALLFQLFKLADKYLLSDLKSLVEATVKLLPLSTSNYAAVLRLIVDHEGLLGFEKMCRDLNERLLVAVHGQWKVPADCVHFWNAYYNDDLAIKQLLMQRMAGLCLKCKPPKLASRCLNGNPLTHENCRVGMRVRTAVERTVRGDTLAAGSRGTVEKYDKNGWTGSTRSLRIISIDWEIKHSWDTKNRHHSTLDNIVVDCH